MKLEKKQILLVSFMLFSLFFGAGNLIFPPFLGYNAGDKSIIALIAFLITSVILPVLGVIVVAKFNGLKDLAAKVGKHFSFIFILLIYLSIGPGLGIPRAASVPFEMAIAPYMTNESNKTIFMVLYSFVFFAIALWLSLTPKKLVSRIGHFLTPLLLLLICVLFFSFIFLGRGSISIVQGNYASNGFMQGFIDGYQTMDTIAALNFGLVISLAIKNFGIKEEKKVINYTIITGIFAGTILMTIYIMLTVIGTFSGVVGQVENGAALLRIVVYNIFGEFGAVFLASIFTLACLTTCVGLITSISQYFSSLQDVVSYKKIVFLITIVSFLICNLGLNMILSISIPILNAIYPMAIVLIILGLTNKLHHKNRYIYPFTIYLTGIISIFYAIDNMKIDMGGFSSLLNKIPFFEAGFAWIWFFLIGLFLSYVYYFITKIYRRNKLNIEEG